MEGSFNHFVSLVEFDKSIYSLRKEISQLEDEVKSTEAKLVAMEHHLEDARLQVKEAQKEVDANERFLLELDERESADKAKLDEITDERAYRALRRELENIKFQRDRAEKALVAAWNKLDVAKARFDEGKGELCAVIESLKGEGELKKAKIMELTTDADLLRSKRPAMEKGVPSEWLEKYSVMRERVSDPVVRVEQGCCSACFCKIASQDMLAVKHHKLLQCRNCYRFLYVRDEES